MSVFGGMISEVIVKILSLERSCPCPPSALRPRQIVLSAAERRRLKKLAYSHTAPYQQVVRVRIVLDAAHGYSNAKIGSDRNTPESRRRS